jgi:predicted nucleic acid-binding protein
MNSTPKDKSAYLEDIFTVRSKKLKELRTIVRSLTDFRNILGVAVQFRLVVDTNIVLGDILWLVSERKNKTAKTALMETIEAGTIDVYAPPLLLVEVEEQIPLIADKKGLDINSMYAEWAVYKETIIIVEPDSEKVQSLKNGVDPDDADFVALAQTIAAAGVFSKDGHIGLMGGNQISIACITHLRNYSRSAAIELNIKVNGVGFAVHGIAAVRGLFSGVKSLLDGIKKAPDWVKISLLAAGLFVVLHPGTRTSISRGLKIALAGIGDATPTVISLIAEAAVLAEKSKTEAQVQLDAAMKELSKNEANGSQI